jgi:transketolase
VRGAFIETLVQLAARDARVVLLTADLGFNVLEPFADAYPERFFNVGVAEQNMMGLATGLADSGFFPFAYSIVSFATLRPLEFLRNGPVHHRLPVRVVGVGGGLDYSLAGPSHYGLEDVGVLRVMPGLTIVAPADKPQARAALEATWDLPGPVYYRMGKGDVGEVPGLAGRFRLGKVEVLREGRDVAILSLGTLAHEAVRASEELAERGIMPQVVVVSCVSPAPVEDLASLLRGVPLAVTYEAHHAVGGLGSLVSEVIAEAGLGCRLARCAATPPNQGLVGGKAYVQEAHGISPHFLVELVMRCLGGERPV